MDPHLHVRHRELHPSFSKLIRHSSCRLVEQCCFWQKIFAIHYQWFLNQLQQWNLIIKICRRTHFRYAYESTREWEYQLRENGNGKFTIKSSRGWITYPVVFCQFTESKTNLINKVFTDILLKIIKIMFAQQS